MASRTFSGSAELGAFESVRNHEGLGDEAARVFEGIRRTASWKTAFTLWASLLMSWFQCATPSRPSARSPTFL